MDDQDLNIPPEVNEKPIGNIESISRVCEKMFAELGRSKLDDIARNVRWMGLRNEIWKAVDEYCQTQGSGRGAAGLLLNVVCPYCGTPNDVGTQTCAACKAPLAEAQPIVCGRCGFLNQPEGSLCVNCGAKL